GVALRGEVLAGHVAGVAAKVNWIFRIGVAIDDALAGVDRGSALGIDDGDLPRVATGILVGDSLDDLGGRQPLFEQRDGLGSVLAIRGGLRGHGADAGLCVRNRGARPKRARLDPDAELVGRGIEGDNRKGAEPRIGSVTGRRYARRLLSV